MCGYGGYDGGTSRNVDLCYGGPAIDDDDNVGDRGGLNISMS